MANFHDDRKGSGSDDDTRREAREEERERNYGTMSFHSREYVNTCPY